MSTPPSLFNAQRVGELMTPSPVALLRDATIGEAMELMEARRFRHMPVIDEDRMLVGLVSQRDILRLAWPTDDEQVAARLTRSALIADVMVREVDTIGAHESVAVAARYMLRTKRDSLPVVSETGHLVGIITAADFLREVVRNGAAADA